jgi:predicted nucleotidyltransferase
MSKPQPSPARFIQPYRYPSPDIPLSTIKRFARQIAAKFQPDKIILFGSYAYGTPHAESDVDLLVIMPARNAIDQSVRIVHAFEPPFSLDLIVRTPRQIEIGLRPDDCNWFLREIVEKGKVLYEAQYGRVGPKGRGRLSGRSATSPRHTATEGPGLLPLSTGSGKVPQSAPPRVRRHRTKNPRPEGSD